MREYGEKKVATKGGECYNNKNITMGIILLCSIGSRERKGEENETKEKTKK